MAGLRRGKGARCHRNIAVGSALCLTLVFLGLAAAPPAAAELAAFRAPYGVFELPLPEGWHLLSFDHLAERQYFFTPEPVTLEELKAGIDLEACFQVRIMTLDSRSLRSPLADLMEGNLAHRIELYREHGVALEGRPAGPQVLAGLAGETALLAQEDDEGFLFLGRKGHLLYEVHYSYQRKKKDRYLPVLAEMAAGLTLFDPEAPRKTTVFRDPTETFAVELPEDWYTMTGAGPGTHFFVSRERIMSATDHFLVGVTLRKMTHLAERLPEQIRTSDQDLVNFWGAAALNEQKGFSQKLLDLRRTQVQDMTGILFERSFHFASAPFYVQELHLILARAGTLYEVILEAPVMEFELYRGTFYRAVETLQMQ